MSDAALRVHPETINIRETAVTVSFGAATFASANRRSPRQTDPTNLRNALILYRKFIEEHQPTTHWANSPQFDHSILRSAYASCQFNVPWNYYQERDYRTLKHFCFPNNDMPDFTGAGVAHAALDDALKQSIGIQYMFAKMGV